MNEDSWLSKYWMTILVIVILIVIFGFVTWQLRNGLDIEPSNITLYGK